MIVLLDEILNEKNILFCVFCPLLKQHRSVRFPQSIIYCGIWHEDLKINRKLRYLSLKIFNSWIKDPLKFI